MIRFRCDGNDYGVSFQSLIKTVEDLKSLELLSKDHKTTVSGAGDVRRCICAKIFCFGRDRSDSKLIARGLSVCSPKDVFSQAKGRRLALQRAIIKNRTQKNGVIIDKNVSKILWKQYFATCNDGIVWRDRKSQEQVNVGT